jgi:hypothetical protein
MNPKEGAPRLGLAVSTSYNYANGASVPAGTKAPEFARRVGYDPAAFCEIAARDRARIAADCDRLKKARQRGSRKVVSPTNKVQQVIASNRHGVHARKSVRGRA